MKTNRLLSLVIAIVMAIGVFSCSKPEPVRSTEALITSFELDLSALEALEDQSYAEGVSVTVQGEEIIIYLPFGLLPDTLSSLLDANAPIIEVSEGATVSPASGTPVKFNVSTPLYFTVTAEDGITKTAYRVRFYEVAQKGYGVMEEYWRKAGNQFTDVFTSNNEKSFALTPSEIVVQIGGLYNSVPLKLVRLSLLDGTEKGYVSLTDGIFTISQVRSLSGDLKGGFIGCNLAAPGESFKVWAWESPTSNPRVLIDWTVDGITLIGTLPSAWAKNFVGRRIFVVGDLKTSAYIYSFACYSLDILRWTVTNGTAAAQPEIIHYTPGGSMTRFENWASIVPIGPAANSDYIVNASNAGSEVGYVNGADKTTKMYAGAVATPKGIATWLEYNGAKYYIPLNTEAYASPHNVNARLYDYTDTDTSEEMADNWWLTPQPAKIEAVTGLANGDASGCIAAIADADGEGFKVVALGTGCGVVVTKFTKKRELTF